MEAKICIDCGVEKPLKFFMPSKPKDKIYYNKRCSKCNTQLCYIRKNKREQPKKNKVLLFCEESCRDLKLCTKCKKPKPFNDFSACRKFGLSYTCKVCCNEYSSSKYHSLSIEEKKILNKNKKKPQKVYKQSPESKRKALIRHKERYRTEPEFREKIRNREKLARDKRITLMDEDQRKQFFEKALESRRKHRMIRQARERNCDLIIPFSKADIVKQDGLICYLCGKSVTEKQATIDHVLPISRGGNHKPENAKIACRLCNITKNAKTLTEYKKWRGDYDRFKPLSLSR